MADEPSIIQVAHITPTLSRRGGGVASFVSRFAQAGEGMGLAATVVGLNDRFAHEDTRVYPQTRFQLFRAWGPRALGFSPGMRRYLLQLDADLVHAHGLRMLVSYEARRLAVRLRRPLIVSPHGQLDPWILRYRSLRKWVAGTLYENRNLRTAACLHVTSLQEARHCREYGLDNPLAVVPIGIDLPACGRAQAVQALDERWPDLRHKKRLLFLSVIYPRKGLVTLAKAWVALHRRWPQWRLVVAGPELSNDRQHAQQVLAAGDALASACFIGTVQGLLKDQVLAGSDVFVLPTQGENFGIVIGEALGAGVPVITTVNAPWPDLRRRDCGWWIDLGLEPLMAALEEAMALDDQHRAAMGQRGRQLIEQDYAWPGVTRKLRRLYEWALERGPQPDFVFLPGQALPQVLETSAALTPGTAGGG